MISIKENIDGTYSLTHVKGGSFHNAKIYDSIEEYGAFYLAYEYETVDIVKKNGDAILLTECTLCDFRNDWIIFSSGDFKGIILKSGEVLNPIAEEIYLGTINSNETSLNFILKLIGGYTIWNSKNGIINELYDSIVEIENKFLKIRNKGRFGLLGFDNRILLKIEYQAIYFYPCSEIFMICEEDSFFLMNFEGEQISSNFESISDYCNGVAIGFKNNYCSIIDNEANWLDNIGGLDIDTRWWEDYFNSMELGYLPIKSSGLYGLYNHITKKILEPISLIPIDFNTKTAIIKLPNNTYGLIDDQLNWLIEPQLLKLQLCVSSFSYDEDLINSVGFPYIAKHPKTLKYGLVSIDGTWITEPCYDEIHINENYSVYDSFLFYLEFEKGDKKGILTTFGTELFCENFTWLDIDEFENQENFMENNMPGRFRLKKGNIYTENDIPTEGVRFYVIKKDVKGYYDAFGVFYLV